MGWVGAGRLNGGARSYSVCAMAEATDPADMALAAEMAAIREDNPGELFAVVVGRGASPRLPELLGGVLWSRSVSRAGGASHFNRTPVAVFRFWEDNLRAAACFLPRTWVLHHSLTEAEMREMETFVDQVRTGEADFRARQAREDAESAAMSGRC